MYLPAAYNHIIPIKNEDASLFSVVLLLWKSHFLRAPRAISGMFVAYRVSQFFRAMFGVLQKTKKHKTRLLKKQRFRGQNLMPCRRK